MKTAFTCFFTLFTMVSIAQSCVGKWITVDDETGKKKSIVEFYKKDEKLYGKITYMYPQSGQDPNAKCTKCTGDRKNQPVLGLQIVRGMKWNGSEWDEGTILDPENGKIYSAKIWLDPENKDRLNMRGYLGPIYRTQRWIRVEP
jgi:uncharacterized protein (DUF2147 family)